MRRRGIVLVVVAGLLVLLGVIAAAMSRLAGQLWASTSAGVDGTAARLLARSGIEYAATRLGEDNAPKTPANPGNQPDDWTYRDERDVPVEKALNPSYAITEPYADAPTGNGRYDAGADFFTDANGNGRFDSWSGRLRGRYGMISGTFHLKIGGTGGIQGGSGGINVNSGLMDDTDINGNGIPDYQDLERFWNGAERHYSPVNPFSRNGRIAFALDQLAQLLGILPPPAELPKTASLQAAQIAWLVQRIAGAPAGAAAAVQDAPPPRPPGIGELIVANRPLGGYRDLDEMAKLFSPADWIRLRDHLTVRSRRNTSAGYRSFALRNSSSNPPAQSRVLYEPDVGYFVDAGSASVETIAAVFCAMGANASAPGISILHLPERCEITPLEALRVAGFLKGRAYTSGFDLYQTLQQTKGTLFLPVSVDPGSATQLFAQFDAMSPGFTQTLKAGWAHALAMPDEPGQPQALAYPWGMDFNCLSFDRYDAPRYPMVSLPSGARDSVDFYLRSPKSNNYISYFLLQDRERTTSGPAFALGFGPVPSVFSVESAGKAVDSAGALRAIRSVSATILGEGAVEARTQRDFENFSFDRAGRRASTVHRFDGGTALGRPARDRTATYPFFSLDACPSMAQSPLLDQRGVYPVFGGSISSSPREYGFPFDYAYYGYGGEVRLSARSWIDPQAAFYRPCWDLEQPERPASARTGLWESNFDDVAKGAQWQRLSPPLLREGFLYGDCLLARFPRLTPTLSLDPDGPVFPWGAPSANPGDFPLVSRAGTVEQGTIEGWFTVVTIEPGWVYAYEGFKQGNPMRAGAMHGYWTQSGGGWSDPAPPTELLEVRHMSFAFSAPEERVAVFVDGLPRGGAGYEADSVDPSRAQKLETPTSCFPNELRMYRERLDPEAIRVHALRGRFWTAAPGFPDPSFTSAKYAFAGQVELGRIAWDGFVPNVLRDAVDRAYGSEADRDKAPIRVDLLLYLKSESEPVRVELPREAWRTGGAPVDFKSVWQSGHPGEPLPRINALKYQVWLDDSALERAWNSPVFDGIEIGCKGRGGYSQLRER